MSDNTLTIALEGDVLLSQFRETVIHFANLVDLLSREVAPGIDIEWLIDDLQAGSALATIVGISEDREPVLRVIRGYGKIGYALERRESIPFPEGVVREAKALTKVIGGKVTAVRFETAETDAIIYGAADVETIVMAARRVSFGAVKGRVQALSSRGRLRFTLYDSVFDKPISCYLLEGQEDRMLEIWGKQVTVMGQVTREPEYGRAVNVRNITSIEPAMEAEQGSYTVARGIFSWSEGDEPAEVSVRRLRDAED